jgi:hypothetical protein
MLAVAADSALSHSNDDDMKLGMHSLPVIDNKHDERSTLAVVQAGKLPLALPWQSQNQTSREDAMRVQLWISSLTLLLPRSAGVFNAIS